MKAPAMPVLCDLSKFTQQPFTLTCYKCNQIIGNYKQTHGG